MFNRDFVLFGHSFISLHSTSAYFISFHSFHVVSFHCMSCYAISFRHLFIHLSLIPFIRFIHPSHFILVIHFISFQFSSSHFFSFVSFLLFVLECQTCCSCLYVALCFILSLSYGLSYFHEFMHPSVHPSLN